MAAPIRRTISVTVTNLNEAPVATNDTAITSENTPVIIDVTANDIDPEGDTLTVLDITNPADGTVVNNGDGTVTYTPDPGFTGPDSFNYLVTDGNDDTTHYWNFNGGTATDSVGTSDGTLTGTTATAGTYGDALSFDEVDDKIVVPDLNYNNEFSVSISFKLDDNSGSLFQYLYSHGDINNTNSLHIFVNEASHGTDPNVLRTVVRDADDTLDNFALQFDISGIVGDGQWHTYALTVSAVDGAKVYLDGALQNSDATRSGGAFDPATDLYLGTREDLISDRFFGGEMDSVRIFDRTLNATEVNDVHTGGAALGAVNVTVSAPSSLTVTTTNDLNNGNTTSVAALIGDDGGDGISLREAITAANNTAGTDSINFNIAANDARHFYYADDGLAGQVSLANIAVTTQALDSNIVGIDPDYVSSWYSIQPTSALPDITDTVIMNGYSQPGSFQNTLSLGNDAILKIELDGSLAGLVDGLVLDTDNSMISGLIINNSGDDGIQINSGHTGNTIAGNFIGTDASGTIARGAADDGIDLNGSGNTIGGTAPATRNLISGNTNDGINAGVLTAASNVVRGNYIGTDRSGSVDLGNGNYGIEIGGSSNTIGGTAAGARNVISGNDFDGIVLDGAGATGNIIEGNYIGTDASGTTDVANSLSGVLLHLGAAGNTIGGITAGARNVISGNTQQGVRIIGPGTVNNVVAGNYIGTDVTGTVDLGNILSGVRLDSGADGNIIGGTAAGARNVISGNDIDGVLIIGTGTDNNVVEGNYIGIDASATTTIGAGSNGVHVQNGANGTIIEDNIIGGSNQRGIEIWGASSGTVIQGNSIGTDITGTLDFGNNWEGIYLGNGAFDNLIGGTVAGDGNRIANSGGNGIRLENSAGTGNAILNNSIFGNSDRGIDLQGGIETNQVTANDLLDTDTGPNNLQNFPVLETVVSSAGNTTITGAIHSTASTTFRIEYFSSTAPDPSGHGEGQTYLGFTTVTTDAAGNATFLENLIGVTVATGDLVSATATVDLGGGIFGDTSEFAANLQSNQTTQIISHNDTWLDDNNQSNNYGQSTSLVVDQSGGGIGDGRILLQFDLSQIPIGAVISGATLQMESTQNGGAFDINVYEVTEAWDEGNGDGTPGEANWDESQTATNWGTSGGVFNSTMVATLNTAATGQHTWNITTLVQDWYDGSATNNGLIIGSSDPGSDTITYDSSEGAIAPKLLITYAVTSNVAPVIDLNDDGTTADTSWSASFNEGDVAISVTDTDADIIDGDSTDFSSLDIILSGFVDTSSERISVGGTSFPYGTAFNPTFVVGATTFVIDYDGDQSLAVSKSGGGDMPAADLLTLIASITYEHTSENPTAGNRTLDFTVYDGTSNSNTATSTITVNAVNDAPTFVGGDGIVTTDIGLGPDSGRDSVVQADGKIIVAGSGETGSGADFIVLRYNTDGTLDTSFGGGDGIAVAAIGAGQDLAYTVTLQSDGKILAAGITHNGTNYDFAVVRFDTGGSLDITFGGGDGIVTTALRTGWDQANGIGVQSDGRIVVGGSADGPNYDFALARYTSAGVLDTTFGGGTGIVFTDIMGGNDFGNDLVIQPDDKILLAGQSWNGTDYDTTLLRFNADGSADLSFGGGDGIVTTPVGVSNDFGQSVALQPDGKYLVGGSYYNGSNYDFAVVRYNSDGTLDATFGSGSGFVTTAIGPDDDNGYSVTTQSDGKILLVGSSNNGADYDFAIVRYNSDGSLDTSFSGDGILTTAIGSGADYARGVSVQADGKIVVTGSSSNGMDGDIAVVRYNPDGSLDTSFDSVLVNTLDGTPAFVEDGPAVILDDNVDVRDTELDALNGGAGDYHGSSLTLVRNGTVNTEDVFSFNDGNGITLVGDELQKVGVAIGKFDTTGTAGQLEINFDNSNGQTPTSADVDNILRQITYLNSSDTPPATAQINWTFDDGNSGSQGSGGALNVVGSTIVNITAIPDLAITAPATATTNEDTAFVYSGANVVQVDDGMVGDNPLQVSLSVANGTLSLASLTGISFVEGADGTSSMIINGLESDLNTALDGLQFTPTADYNGADTLNITTAISADLVGQYTFDAGTAVDDSAGTAYDGTFTGDATTVTDGTRGEVLSLDGAGDYVDFSHRFGDSADVSFSGWVNLASADTAGAEVFNLGGVFGLRLDATGGIGGYHAFVYDSVGFSTITIPGALAGTGWHHVAATFDSGTNTLDLYLDGTQVGTTTTTGGINYGAPIVTSTTLIGGHISQSTYDFNGMIDDSRIYSRALSAEEIGALASDNSVTTDSVAITVAAVNDAPVGLPAITGTVTEDQILTADTSGISDNDGLGAFSYQWLRGGSVITGATAATYTLGDADVGTLISVRVSYTDGEGTNEGPLTSAQTAAVANVNDAPIGLPAITGTVTEDQILTADTSGISDNDGLGAFSYQWLRGGSVITGATASTYTLGDADVGTLISVRVSYTDGEGTNEGPLTSAQTAAVANVNDAPVGLPAITGTVTEDQILTADTSGISDNDGLGAFSYQWLRGGSVITGATASTYTLGDADVGTLISVRVSYTDGEGTSEGPLTSAQTAAVVNVNDAPVGLPAITGTVTEDQILTADTSGISDNDGLGAFSYQWLRGGSVITGATAATYTLGDADVGTLISVRVSYTDGEGTSEGPLTSAQTAAVVNVNDAPVGLPAITGTVTEDQILTADTSGISDNDGLGAFSYQWLRGGSVITGATAATYTLGDADVGTLISVRVSYTDGEGTSEGPLTSAQTAAVVNVNDAPVGLPAITGTVTEDQILTADTSGISDNDGLGAFSYQWLRGGSVITGATAATYTLGDADVGTLISVRVSYTDGEGTSEGPLTSAQTAAVANVNDAPVGLPAITGTVTEDQILTADTSGISDNDGLGAFSYQWLRGGSVITGATASTYTLGDADVGTLISVRVSYTDGEGTSEGPLTSAQTAAVVNVNDAPVGLPAITGTVTEDQILTADTSGISDNDGLGAFSYQWLRGGSVITGATAATYTLGDADVGTLISVRVSYTDGEGTSEGPLTSAQTAAVVNVNDAPVGLPAITGTVTEDQILTADTSGISDNDGLGAFSYQWLRGGSVITGATAATYTLGDADVGTLISVRVSYTDGEGTSEGPLTSAQTAAVVNVNDAPVGLPAITGTVTEDQILTADTSGISDNDGLGAFSYQWLRGGSVITGATAATYTLGDADVGTLISVRVSYTDGEGTNEGPLLQPRPQRSLMSMTHRSACPPSPARLPKTRF